MLASIIGWAFIVFGTIWALGAFMVGGMTEYRAGWSDIPPEILWSVPAIAIGVAIVWR